MQILYTTHAAAYLLQEEEGVDEGQRVQLQEKIQEHLFSLSVSTESSNGG